MGVRAGAELLVERDQELERLGTLIDEVPAGPGRLVIVEGPPGIGKTRLLAAARALAADAGLRILTARGSPIEWEFGFGVVRQLFEAPLRGLRSDLRRAVVAGAAALAEPVVTGGGDAPQPTIFPVLHGLFWLCVNLADQAPLLVAVDDAHWADEASLQWLGYVARRLEDVRALLVVTRRGAEPGATTLMLDHLAAEPGAEVLRLGPLSEGAAAELTEQVSGARASVEFARACHSRTGGNPFLLRELLASLAADGVDPGTDAGAARVMALRPEGVSRTVLARLGGLGEACRSLARAVAVLETDVEARHAAALSGLTLHDVAGAADALAATEILRPGEPLAFKHPLVRDAVYDDLPSGRRADLHRRAAELLHGEEAPPERVAAHLLRAPNSGDGWAVARLRVAARAALARGAQAPAVAYLERALAEPPPPQSRAGVLHELGEAQARSAPTLAAERLREALALTPDPLERLHIRRLLANVLMNTVQPAESFDTLERAIAELPAGVDAELRLRAEADLLTIGLMARSLFTRVAERVEVLPALQGATPGERLVLGQVARYRALRGAPWSEVVLLAQRAAAGGQLLYDQMPDSGTFPMTVWSILIDGRAHEVDRFIELIHEDAARRGSLVGAAIAAFSSARFHEMGGDLRASEASARRALELSLEIGFPVGLPAALSRLVKALIERGRLEEAGQTLERFGMTGELPDMYFFDNLLLVRGELRIAQGRTREGLDDLLEIGRREHESGKHEPSLIWRSLGAPALAALGAREQALALATEELEQSRHRGIIWTAGLALRALGLVLGGQEGMARLSEAAAMLAPSPFRLDYAHALADFGAALRRTNQRSQAREALRLALDLAHRCGAEALEETVRTELQATGARPRNIVLTGVDSLTASERRVAQLAARGLGNTQIAQSLFVTRKAVEKHLGNAYGKLEITSRAQLADALRQSD